MFPMIEKEWLESIEIDLTYVDDNYLDAEEDGIYLDAISVRTGPPQAITTGTNAPFRAFRTQWGVTHLVDSE